MNISFKGLSNTRYVADQQAGFDCWLEAIENVVQLYYGDTAGNLNKLSDYLRQAMIQDNYAGYNAQTDNVDSPMVRYPEILARCGVSTKWYNFGKGEQFDHRALMQVLDQNRIALAVVNVQHLPNYGGQKGYHAMVIANYVVDANNVLFYRGLDSNFEKQEQYWRALYLQNALNFNPLMLKGQAQLLITDNRAHWKN